MNPTCDLHRISPEGTCLETLSASEIDALFHESRRDIHDLVRHCVMAVLNSGSESDDVRALIEANRDFDIIVERTSAGIQLDLINAPREAFVVYRNTYNGQENESLKLIEGLRQHIFAVIRDIIFLKTEIERTGKFDLNSSTGLSDVVFMILRNAGIFGKLGRHKIIACWGGHAIADNEYDYTVAVGHQCGLRMMDIITGCGPGAMSGPMEGAALAHAKQRLEDGRFIGLTEPGIISSEAPNPIVRQLVILPDIEKRLEAFVRLAHGIIIFPGGAGTAEELFYLLGLLLHPDNLDQPFPLILTGPASSRDYFQALDRFVRRTLGDEAAGRYRIIIDDPEEVAVVMNQGLLAVKRHRDGNLDSYYFNRNLTAPLDFQLPFHPTHRAVAELQLNLDRPPNLLAADVRRVMSAIVAGNVKPEGIRQVEEQGPFVIHGQAELMSGLDELLRSFVDQGRMRLHGEYTPCYRLAGQDGTAG